MAASVGKLDWPDYTVIAAYFIVIIGVGALSAKKSKRDSVAGFFLARRTMHWIPVGASIFASNIGSEHFVGLAGSAALSGITVAGFELNAMFVLLLLGWIFLPVYLSSGVYTVPQYLKLRFGGHRIETLLSVVGLVNYIFTKISADLFAGTLFIHACFNLSVYPAIVALLLLSAVFTIAGGQSAVIWVDLIQVCLMIAGALSLSILGFVTVGGYDTLMHKFYYKQPSDSVVLFDANNISCSQVSKEYSHLLRPATDTDLPWPGAIFGITISALWYWCSDQLIVQRGLSARNLSHVKGGSVLAGYCKFLPLWLMVFPGMISRVLYTDEIACSKPEACEKACGSRTGCSNYAYPFLVINLLPSGARGLMLAVMLATLMCALSAVFNSSSTIFTVNIWNKVRKQASQFEQLIVGRVFVMFMLAVAIVWIPVMASSQNAKLFDYLQKVTSCLSPPICAILIMGMLWERTTEKGAFWGLLIGFAIGVCRFGLDFGYPAPVCGSGEPDNRPLVLSAVHYLHFGALLFLIVIIIVTTISLMTEPINEKRLVRLTFWSRHSTELRLSEESSDTLGNTNSQIPGCENGGFTGSSNSISDIPMGNLHRRCPIPVPLGTRPRQSRCHRILTTIFGLPASGEHGAKPEHKLTPEEELQEALEVIAEDPKWKLVADCNGIFLLAAAVFIWGYFA